MVADRLLVGTRKGLFVLKRTASLQWQIDATHFLAEPVSMVLHDARADVLHVALNLGHFGVKMWRSRGFSTSATSRWEETPAPAFPPQPEAAKDEAPWNLEQVWALESGGADQPGLLWAGTLPGGLFVSRDQGDSWELNRPLWDREERQQWSGGGYDTPGIHSICVDPRHSQTVRVAISTGGIWQTDDGGGRWTLIGNGMYADYMPEDMRTDPLFQDVHRLVQCTSDSQALWVQHHCGIFVSRDGAQNFQQIRAQPSSFGFAVAVHPHDANTAWFVPAVKDECRVPVDGKFVVTRTRDGGNTFESLRKGLPQDAAYDLVYRHGLDIDASGERLAMGSTTGSLWITENGGDAWTQISAHLPPIYCLRFC
jgi:hypothetical protein